MSHHAIPQDKVLNLQSVLSLFPRIENVCLVRNEKKNCVYFHRDRMSVISLEQVSFNFSYQTEQPSQLFQVHFQPTQNGKLVLGTVAGIIPEILQQLQLQCLNKAAPELGKTRRWIF